MLENFDALPNVLNAKEVQNFLGISRSSTYDLMHRTDFPTLHVNARLLVTKANLKSWLESHTNGDYGIQ
ncbi:MAG: helix-turn-helix domain-containing protein [Oscillospiraceae bacterium]|nr:helix-turn-helix domain-containing protein [Oscillospiraceae bacterium]